MSNAASVGQIPLKRSAASQALTKMCALSTANQVRGEVPSLTPSCFPASSYALQKQSKAKKKEFVPAKTEVSLPSVPADCAAPSPSSKAPSTSIKWMQDNDDWHCSVCNYVGELIVCSGPCGRCFHAACLGVDTVPSDDFFCDLCKSNQVKCGVCLGVLPIKDAAKCVFAACHKYFHPACMDSFEDSTRGKICPRHRCASCKEKAPPGQRSSQLIACACIKCNRVWHKKCLPVETVVALDIDAPHPLAVCCDYHPEEQAYIRKKNEEKCDNLKLATLSSVKQDEQGLLLNPDCPFEVNETTVPYKTWREALELWDMWSLGKYRLRADVAQCGGVKDRPAPFTLVKRNVWRAPRPRKLDSDEQDLQMCTCKPGTDCGDACVNRSLKIECNPAMCVNGRSCTNRALQQRSYAKLRLFKSALCGYGMKTLEDVSPGQLVQEYVGEVVTTGEMHNRLATYRPGQPVYFFNMTTELVIDASLMGSMARFINHSCDPNCVTEKWNVGSEIRMGIFAAKKIPKGEEVTYNYQFQSFGEIKERCMCGSKNCTGNFDGVPLEGQPGNEKK